MIVNSPGILVLLLAALTMLGCVIGYCVSQITVKQSARRAIESARKAMREERNGSDSAADKGRGTTNASHGAGEILDDEESVERERALAEKSEGQERLIQKLEKQVETLEERHQRLQGQFTSYRANRSREVAAALHSSVSQSDTDDLPTLSRKVDPVTGMVAESSHNDGNPLRNTLKQPLTELDIPTLAESELPELEDDLEFDVAGSGQGETHRGG